MPELAPDENHLLASSSVVKSIRYQSEELIFTTFDDQADVILRLVSKPQAIIIDGKTVEMKSQSGTDFWKWTPLEKGGVVSLSYTGGSTVTLKL